MKVFKEEQKFTQSWFIIFLILGAIVPMILVVKKYFNGEMTVTGVLTFILTLMFCLGIFWAIKLRTKIDEKGIHYQFFPFHIKTKTIQWSQVQEVYVRKYDAISEYGGWGLRVGTLWKGKKGIAVSVRGDLGLQIQLKNSKKILIGTQKETAINRVLKTYESKIN
ncbi:hypothetical protein [Tenacibaculum sp. 190524A02b]|uniref:PH domain-containing protein n=1 Tax=Tenacibaculum vairaonense TaxID=3137860 RepID=A0ABP1FBW1_9FLAO